MNSPVNNSDTVLSVHFPDPVPSIPPPPKHEPETLKERARGKDIHPHYKRTLARELYGLEHPAPAVPIFRIAFVCLAIYALIWWAI